jgi:6,7-dimethyl-8-ribityllumazine synthase
MESATTTKRIAFVQACWHREIVDQGRDAFVAEIGRHGMSAAQIDFYEVPGSLEIPLQAKLLAQTENMPLSLLLALSSTVVSIGMSLSHKPSLTH